MVQDKSGSEHYTAFILIYVITYRSEDIKTNHCRTDVFKCAFPLLTWSNIFVSYNSLPSNLETNNLKNQMFTKSCLQYSKCNRVTFINQEHCVREVLRWSLSLIFLHCLYFNTLGTKINKTLLELKLYM